MDMVDQRKVMSHESCQILHAQTCPVPSLTSQQSAKPPT